MKLSAEGSEFFFYYSLLGNDITSEPFRNLLSPDFEPERASVRIRSSKQVLKSFLSQQPSLQVGIKISNSTLISGSIFLCFIIYTVGPSQIHLCSGSESLGSTDVSLSALSSVSVDLESKAAMVEGAFILQPPQRFKKSLPADLQPTVGISVSLRRDEVAQQVHLRKISYSLK